MPTAGRGPAALRILAIGAVPGELDSDVVLRGDQFETLLEASELAGAAPPAPPEAAAAGAAGGPRGELDHRVVALGAVLARQTHAQRDQLLLEALLPARIASSFRCRCSLLMQTSVSSASGSDTLPRSTSLQRGKASSSSDSGSVTIGQSLRFCLE